MKLDTEDLLQCKRNATDLIETFSMIVESMGAFEDADGMELLQAIVNKASPVLDDLLKSIWQTEAVESLIIMKIATELAKEQIANQMKTGRSLNEIAEHSAVMARDIVMLSKGE